MFINFLFSAAVMIDPNVDIQKHLQKVSYEKFQVDFEYQYHEEGADVTKGEHGTLSINKKQYQIKFKNREIICNGIKIWNFDKDSNTVNIIENIDDDDNPLLLLNRYEKIFKIKDHIKKNGLYIVTMLPKEEDNDYDIKSLEIFCDDDFIRQLNIFNEDGSWMTIRFYKWNTKIKIPNAFFSFDPKKQNIKVVNLD